MSSPTHVTRSLFTSAALVVLLLASPASARLNVVVGKSGPAFKLGKQSVPFSAVAKGQQQLGPYTLTKNTNTGKLDVKRSWTFGKTEASNTRSYLPNGKLYGWSLSTGKLEVGHVSTMRGRDTDRGRWKWKMWITSEPKPLTIWAKGTHEKGAMKHHESVSGPYGTVSKTINRDGTVAKKYSPPGSALNRPALPAPSPR